MANITVTNVTTTVMKPVEEKKKKITLELSAKEAVALYVLVGSVTGRYDTTLRGATYEIFNALDRHILKSDLNKDVKVNPTAVIEFKKYVSDCEELVK